MLKFISKFVLNIFPSVAASVIGAYIVHNYINAKPAEPPPAVAASTLASKVDYGVRADGPSIMPIPVNAKVVEAEAPVVARERAEPGPIASTSEKAATGRDKHSAVHVRNAHVLARAAGEHSGVVNRGGRLAENSATQRGHLQGNNAGSPAVRSGPILMPAVDFVPDERSRDAPAQARIGTMSGTPRTDPDRIVPPTAELPLMKRLSAFSTDVETTLVSQTQSAADGIVTTAKSVFHAVLPR